MKGGLYRLPTKDECKECYEMMGNQVPCFKLDFCCLKRKFDTEKNDSGLFTEYPNACASCKDKNCLGCIMRM